MKSQNIRKKKNLKFAYRSVEWVRLMMFKISVFY